MQHEAGVVAKRIIYTAAVGTAAAALLGGESFSSSSELFGMSVPDPIVAGLSIGIGSGLGVLLQDTIIEKLLKDSPDSIRGLEVVAVEGGLAVAGGLIGLSYLAGIEPSLNGALLSAGSYVGGSWIHANLDQSLLGMLY